MYAGDTMSGKDAVTVPPTDLLTEAYTDDEDSGDNTGGDRVETAPIAVNPPALPLTYDNTDSNGFADIDVPLESIGITSACNYLSDGIQYILPYGYYNADTAPSNAAMVTLRLFSFLLGFGREIMTKWRCSVWGWIVLVFC